MSRPARHHKIDLPRGFYALLCHPTGSPEDQWDRMERLVGEAANMEALLRRLTTHILASEARKAVGGVMADAEAILHRIEGGK